MTTLIIILAVLFLSLIILVPLLEKFAGKGIGQPSPAIMKWFFPMLALVLVLRLIQYYYG